MSNPHARVIDEDRAAATRSRVLVHDAKLDRSTSFVRASRRAFLLAATTFVAACTARYGLPSQGVLGLRPNPPRWFRQERQSAERRSRGESSTTSPAVLTDSKRWMANPPGAEIVWNAIRAASSA
jgi:hypothetical protein